jgi:AraC family transcriptional regulator
MDWITGIQRAIDFVEDNLTEELDFAEIAAKAYSSSFHFQRMFAILCGFSLGEYIRNRRLTLAGSELASTDIKVIDAALKYGYESPESFGRAFMRFHGITPSQAKLKGANLRSYSRLSVKLILDGGSIMDYRIEKKDQFRVIGVKKMFPNDTEQSFKLLPEFWAQCHKDGTVKKLCSYYEKGNVFGDSLLGVCFAAKAGEKDFPYAIGAANNNRAAEEGLAEEIIPAHTWVVFTCTGAMPEAIQKLWRRIYTEFFPTSEYQPYGDLDIEVYPDGDMNSPDYKSEIWIPVNKK